MDIWGGGVDGCDDIPTSQKQKLPNVFNESPKGMHIAQELLGF